MSFTSPWASSPSAPNSKDEEQTLTHHHQPRTCRILDSRISRSRSYFNANFFKKHAARSVKRQLFLMLGADRAG